MGTSLSALLAALLPVLEERPWAALRVGMTNPPYVLDQLDGLARALRHPQVFAFLHVPVQSGSDRVLGPDGVRPRGAFSAGVESSLVLGGRRASSREAWSPPAGVGRESPGPSRPPANDQA